MHLASPAPSVVFAAVSVVLLAACGRAPAAGGDATGAAPAAAQAQEAPPTVAEAQEAPHVASPDAEPRAPEARNTPALARAVDDHGWAPFATVAGIDLVHPSARVERIGFHESNHNGARQLDVLDTAVEPMTLDGRQRGTGSRSAADVVVDPEVEIRSPVSGIVERAGSYVLYCDYSDDYVVIAPDAQPEWEVKVLHIDGVQVREGDRVEAGITVLAPRPTPLPFESQVDEHTAGPSWPHVHIEVVDPSIPNPPSPGGGC